MNEMTEKELQRAHLIFSRFETAPLPELEDYILTIRKKDWSCEVTPTMELGVKYAIYLLNKRGFC